MGLDNYKVSEGGCWEFQGYVMPNGYSRVQGGLGHRAAWKAANGPIPDGMCVLHKCDNRRCINPEHLFLGTKKDNTRDMMQKGRARFVGLQSPNCRKPTAPKGERHKNSKLTEAAIDAIRGWYALGVRQVDLASMFHVRQCHISRIVRKESWAHVNY